MNINRYTHRTSPDGFSYVNATEDERAAYRAKNKRHPTQYRLACDTCGTRIWGSGLAIGSHRKACYAKQQAAQS